MHQTTRWSLASPLVRWHLRHVLVIWVGARILVMMAFAASSSFAPPGMVLDPPMAMATSPVATLVSLIVVMLVSEIDRRWLGAPLLFANLGYSWRWIATTTAALALGLETVLQVVVRVSGMTK